MNKEEIIKEKKCKHHFVEEGRVREYIYPYGDNVSLVLYCDKCGKVITKIIKYCN